VKCLTDIFASRASVEGNLARPPFPAPQRLHQGGPHPDRNGASQAFRLIVPTCPQPTRSCRNGDQGERREQRSLTMNHSDHPLRHLPGKLRPPAVLELVHKGIGGGSENGGSACREKAGGPVVTFCTRTTFGKSCPPWSRTARATGVRWRLQPRAAGRADQLPSASCNSRQVGRTTGAGGREKEIKESTPQRRG
jgi:hypothetical protein